MANENKNPQQASSPYEDPELIRRAQGSDEYLRRLVAVRMSDDRLQAMSADESDIGYLVAREQAEDMAKVLISFELEHGYIDLPHSPEET